MPRSIVSDDLKRRAWDLRHNDGKSVRKIARELNVSVGTVSDCTRGERPGTEPGAAPPTRLPDPAPEAGGPRLPESLAQPLEPFTANVPGWWLSLGDTHIPMHDRATIECAVTEAREKCAVGVLLNGDILDMFGITPFFRVPTKERFKDEIDAGKQFLEWLRSRLPKARIIYRQGNHEFRLVRYVAERAAALYDLEEVHLPHLLRMADRGVEWVQDKRKVFIGKLPTLHGHELRKGRGVNPARFAFLRTNATVLVNHFHQTGEHHVRTFDDRHIGVWAVGCACFIHPDYDPFNDWNHGYAMLEVAADGYAKVHNRRVLNGRVV